MITILQWLIYELINCITRSNKKTSSSKHFSPLLQVIFPNKTFACCSLDVRLIDFLISVIFNCSCSSLSYYFGHVQKVNVCWCDLFGHLQIFRSYSFGHVNSVKCFTLIKIWDSVYTYNKPYS